MWKDAWASGVLSERRRVTFLTRREFAAQLEKRTWAIATDVGLGLVKKREEVWATEFSCV
jgi:hypothetical protein